MNHWKKDRIIKDNNGDGDAGDPSVGTIAIRRITIQHPLDDDFQRFNGDDDNNNDNDKERRNDTKHVTRISMQTIFNNMYNNSNKLLLESPATTTRK